MDVFYFETLLSYTAAALHVMLLLILIFMLVRTRNVGFLWLGIALVLWPFACNFLGHLVGHALAADQPVAWFPAKILRTHQISVSTFFICMETTKEIVTGLLLFLAIFYFGRPNTVRAS